MRGIHKPSTLLLINWCASNYDLFRLKENLTHIIRQCQKGDKAAQKELFHLFLPYVTSICKRYLRNLSMLADAVQETFLLTFKGLENTFDTEKGAFKPWLRKIAINCSLKINQRFKSYTDLDDLPHSATDNAFAAKAEMELTTQDLMKILQTSPPPYREVFNLYVIDGFSHQEIAHLLGITTHSSRKKLQRARDFLKKSFEQYPELLADTNYGKNVKL